MPDTPKTWRLALGFALSLSLLMGLVVVILDYTTNGKLVGGDWSLVHRLWLLFDRWWYAWFAIALGYACLTAMIVALLRELSFRMFLLAGAMIGLLCAGSFLLLSMDGTMAVPVWSLAAIWLLFWGFAAGVAVTINAVFCLIAGLPWRERCRKA